MMIANILTITMTSPTKRNYHLIWWHISFLPELDVGFLIGNEYPVTLYGFWIGLYCPSYKDFGYHVWFICARGHTPTISLLFN